MNKHKKKIGVKEIQDMFDVKRNLKKLKKHSGFETQTESNFENNEYDNFFDEATTRETQVSIPNTKSIGSNSLELELGLEKLRSELKDSDKSIEQNFTNKFHEVERLKLDKSDFRWWIGGVIAAALLISGLVYSLSYSKILEDIDDIEEKQEEMNLNIQDLSNPK